MDELACGSSWFAFVRDEWVEARGADGGSVESELEREDGAGVWSDFG